MRKFSITSGLPTSLWYALGILGATCYAALYSVSPRSWTFAIAYWVIVGVFLYCYSRIQPFDILSPIVGLVILLFLYSFATGLFVEEFGATYYGEPASDWVLLVYYITCIAGLVGVALGALLGSRVSASPWKQRKERSIAHGLRPNPIIIKKMMFWSAVLGAVLAVFVLPLFNIFHVAPYSERALALRVERSADTGSGLKEVFLSRLPATYILCSATLLMLTARHRWVRFLALGIFLAYIVANTLAGWRGAVVAALLIPLVYYHYRVRALSLRVAIIGGVSLYFFVNGLSVARVSSNPAEMVAFMRENIGANGLAFASLSSSGELMVGGNLVRLISGIEAGETGFTYGKSVLDDLLVFIPRSFYPGRPLPLSERFVEVFYPGLLETGGGHGLFILQDGYWAFGIPGVFLFMLVYGWLVQKIYLGFMHHLTNDITVLCYSAVYGAIVMAAVRTGLIGSLKAALIGSIPFIVLWLLVQLRLPGAQGALRAPPMGPEFTRPPLV